MHACTWKLNWGETRQHFTDWWRQEGLVIGAWTPPAAGGTQTAEPVPEWPPGDTRLHCTDVDRRARYCHAVLGRSCFGADILPVAESDIGPGSLALALGCEPGFTPETVWFAPAFRDAPDVNALPPIRFNPESPWWQVHEAQLRRHKELSQGRYLVGFPDLVENIDILASLRDPQMLMLDMVENPEWVCRSVREINQAFFEGYMRLYDICREPDGSSVWGAFRIWGPGRIAKVQCDASAMFSPGMFRDLVKPTLAEQCAWLDGAIYHLDGTQCLCHLDALLEIPCLQAIEWTPQAGIEGGSHARWFPLYKRILDAGKSVQIVGARVEEIDDILNAIGAKGVCILCDFTTPEDVDSAARLADRWRRDSG